MLAEKIETLIAPIIHDLGLELWMCEVHNQGHHSLLRIYIDRDGKGVTLDDCTEVSRAVGAILDVEDLIKNRYQLEVSSPGLERQLSTATHFARYVGCEVKIKFRVPQNKHKNCHARIEKVEDDKIFLNVGNEKLIVMLGDIQTARLISDLALKKCQ